MSRKYVIIESSDVSSVNFDEVLETSENTLRYNVDGTQTFVKYEGNKPRFLYGKDTLSYSEMLETLATDSWTDTNAPE